MIEYSYRAASRRSRTRLSASALIQAAGRWRTWLAEDYRVALFRLQRERGINRRPLDIAIPEANAALRSPGLRQRNIWAENAVLKRLQIRAAWILFDWLGLETIPRAYWHILRKQPDPARAIGELAEALDSDLDALRARDPSHLETFQTNVRLVSQSDLNGAAITNDIRARIGALTRHGQNGRALELKRIVALLNEAEELYRLSVANALFLDHAAVASAAVEWRWRASRVALEDALAIRQVSIAWADIAIALRRLKAQHEYLTSQSSDVDYEVDLQELKNVLSGIEARPMTEVLQRLYQAQGLMLNATGGHRSAFEALSGSSAHSTDDLLRSIRLVNATSHLAVSSEFRLTKSQVDRAFRVVTLDRYPVPETNSYSDAVSHYRAAVRHRSYLLAVLT